MSEYEKMWQELGLDVSLHNEVLTNINRLFEKAVLSQKNRPKSMKYFDDAIHESHGAAVAELLKEKEKGKKIVGYFCIYVPEEIIRALDLVPVLLCGGTNFSIPYAEKMFPRDICPLVKSTLGLAFSKTCPYAPIKSLTVGETTCDAKKKTWDILAQKVNFHVLELPNKKGVIDDIDGLLSAIADRYLKLNCSCFTPNDDRMKTVVNLAKESNVKGVVQYILQYCHTYNIEAIRVEGALKQANIPSIKIETDYSEEDTGQIRTRLEAFLEKLA